MMATGVRAITRSRMREWASNLITKRHTPILVMGIGHHDAAGEFSLISVESMTNEELEHALNRAIIFIQNRPAPGEMESEA